MKKIVVLAIIALLVAAGAWFGFFKKKALPSADDHSIADKFVAKAEKRDIDFAIEVAGDVTPQFQINILPEVGGKIKKLYILPGQTVKKGDKLLEIDDTDLLTEKSSAETEIDGARLAVDKHRRNFERSKELFEAKLISREVYDNLSSELAMAENDFVRAQRKVQAVDDKLFKTHILAPTDGTVLVVPVIEGQVVVAAASVSSGTPLMTIADLSKLLIDTHVNQVDVAKLKLNQKVKLTTEFLKGEGMEASVAFIAPGATIRSNIKGFQVQALIENPDPRLRPGMTVMMKVPVASAQDAVAVPIGAVFKGDDGKKVVYVRHEDGTVEKRAVKVGVTDLNFAEIKSGLDTGEEILLVEQETGEKKS